MLLPTLPGCCVYAPLDQGDWRACQVGQMERAQAGSFRELHGARLLNHLIKGPHQAESCRAGLGREAGFGRPEGDQPCDGAPGRAREGQGAPRGPGLRQRGKATPLPFISVSVRR